MAGRKATLEIDPEEERAEQEFKDGDDVGAFQPEHESAQDESQQNYDEKYNELQAEKQELLNRLAELEVHENLISDQYGLMATVPDLVVTVTLNYEPEPHPNDESGVVKFQPKVDMPMKAGDILNMYPPRGRREAMPIPKAKLKAMAEYYAPKGIVYWDGTKLPEQGGETKEEAIIRGKRTFINTVGELKYHLLVQKTEIGINKGHNAVPDDDVLRITEPTTMKMISISDKCKRDLKLEGIAV